MSDPTNGPGRPTAYEVLGVAPGIPQHLLAPAYQQRRAQFEAARAGGTDPATVDAWVAELDGAWRVLADPGARATYDASLGFAPPQYATGPPAAPQQPVPQPAEKGGRLGQVVGGLVALAITVGLGVWFSQRDAEREASLRDDAGTLIEATTIPASQLRVGDCFLEEGPAPPPSEAASLQQVKAVPCDEPHNNEVIHSAFLLGATYPDTDAIREQVGKDCVPEFRRFIGIPFERSSLELGYIYPDKISFLQGTRYLECYVLDPSGPVTGSLKGSAR